MSRPVAPQSPGPLTATGSPDEAPRPVSVADLEAIVHLERAAFGLAAWTEEAVRGELEQPSFVGVRIDQGYALGRALPPEAELVRIAVHPGSRRRGLGRRLLVGFQDACLAHGCTRLFLEVRADNDAAIALYASRGWRRGGRRRAYYADGTDAIVMVREPS